MIILSSLLHLILFSLIFYSNGSQKRFFIPPGYTVDIVAPPKEVAKAPQVKKKRAKPKRVRRESTRSKTKPAVKSVPEKKSAVEKKVRKQQIKKKPIRTADKTIKKRVTEETVKKESLLKTVERMESERSLKLKETEMRLAFNRIREKEALAGKLIDKSPGPKLPASKSENESKTADEIKRAIERIESKRRLKEKEDEIQAAFKKSKKDELFKEEMLDLSPEPEMPLPKKARKTKKSDNVKESLEEWKKKLKEKEAGFKEAFNRSKEKEELREKVIKEIIREKEGISATDFRPMEYNFELKGERGLTARFKRGAVSDEIAVAIAELIAKRIGDAWEVDEFLSRRPDFFSLKSIVTIKVGQAGTILDIVVEKRSANSAFQKSVLKAIEESGPLPLEELHIRGGFEIGLTFSPIKPN